MSLPTIDYTITLGSMVEIGTIVCGGFLALVTMRNTITNLKDDMTDMKTEIKKVGEVLVKMAVTQDRLDRVEQDIRDMRHGRGFIQQRSDGGINGEYP